MSEYKALTARALHQIRPLDESCLKRHDEGYYEAPAARVRPKSEYDIWTTARDNFRET